MPIPKAIGARPVSASDSTQPFSTPTLRPGATGLNLRKTIDALETSELAIMKNLTWTQEGGLSTRSGTMKIAQASGSSPGRVHTILSLRDPFATGYINRLFGIDNSLYKATFAQTAGSTEDTTEIKAGYFSGSPLVMVPYRPTLSGQAWAFIADSNANESTKMVKASTSGDVREIGLPFPRDAAGERLILGHESIYEDVPSDNTVRFGREGRADLLFVPPINAEIEKTAHLDEPGHPDHDQPLDGPPRGDPTGHEQWYGKSSEGVADGIVKTHLNDSTNKGQHVSLRASLQGDNQTGKAYYVWAIRRITPHVDFTKVTQTGGTGTTDPHVRDATDDDQVHFWMKMEDPSHITEIRVYLLIDHPLDWDNDPVGDEVGRSVKNGTLLPGNAQSGKRGSRDAYVKAISPGDLTDFYTGDKTAKDTAEDTADSQEDEDDLAERDRDQDPQPVTQNDTGFHIDEETGDTIPYIPTRSARDHKAKTNKKALPVEGGAGQHEWVEFGTPENPLRRGDFRRLGSGTEDYEPSWSHITGVALYLGVKAGIQLPDRPKVYFQQLYLTGGAGPDTTAPGSAGYDYRYTHFDKDTGAESNGSGVLAEADPYGVFPNRRSVVINPSQHGDNGLGGGSANAAIRQKFYRRGGSLGNHWYFIGKNGADGESLEDFKTDAQITLADTIPATNAQPITTVDHKGDIKFAVPLKALWGPVQDTLFGCGDRYRPGHLYWSNPGAPDHWSPYNSLEICSPSEELINGGFFGGQVFVFSRERMYWVYPNLSGDGTVTATPSACMKGLFTHMGVAVGSSGIFFVNRDGVWRTTGGEAQLLSAPIGDEDDGGIFSERDSVNTVYRRIDWNDPQDIRLEVWGTELWFQYRDKGGETNHLIWDSLSNRWKWYQFSAAQSSGYLATMYADTTQHRDKSTMLLGSKGSGFVYTHEKLDVGGNPIRGDDNWPISAQLRTGAWDVGRGREKKLFGDVFVDMNRDGAEITVQAFLDNWTIEKPVNQINTGSDRTQYTIDPFDNVPGRGQNIALDLSWTSAGSQPRVQQLGVSVSPEPEETKNRATRWDDLGAAEEKYVTGVMIECDTGGASKDIIVEYIGGIGHDDDTQIAQTVTIDTDGTNTRQRRFFSWPAVQVDRIRLRSTDDVPWTLYECSWIAQQEPPRIAQVDSHFEIQADSYYTGLDLVINTLGVAKIFNIFVDETRLTNPATGDEKFSVYASGRNVVHLSFGPGRGHVYRFVAVDANPCLLYSHKWLVEQEPTATTNWNQNWTIGGTHTDKYVKGVKLECDTFGFAKTVIVEIDGVTAATLTVNTPDRRVVHKAFAQVRGRVVRIRATDNNPRRLYSASLIFDEEPLGLDRWETQELTLGTPGWKALVEGWITYRSTETMTMSVTIMSEDGTSREKTYYLPDTDGVKRQYHLTFEAAKGVQFKFLFLSTADFWLYRPESMLKIMDWGGEIRGVQPFGDDNLDLTRSLHDATPGASLPYKSSTQGRLSQ